MPPPDYHALLSSIRTILRRVILGLHEFFRAPWSAYGGLVAGRGASEEYLQALRNLNRDVVVVYVLADWYFGASDRLRGLAKGLNDLIGMSLPFNPPEQLGVLLTHVSRAYLKDEYGLTVILSRSCLEAVVRHIYRSKRMTMPTDLVKQIQWLHRSGILSRRGLRLADTLRLRGNKAVHDDFTMCHNREAARDAMGSLLDLFVELEPYVATKVSS